jgi:hypothetical protein
MEYGNGWAPMIELDMTYVCTFETFLVKAAKNHSNKIFYLGSVCQGNPPGLGMQISHPPVK